MESTHLQKWLKLGDADFQFDLTPGQLQAVADGHRNLMSLLSQGSQSIYGLHTGYGSNVLSRRDPGQWQIVQKDLLDYLKVGVGPSLPESVVRRALRIQILKTAQGHSGIHPETVRQLIELSNSKTLPGVPCYGSLGASGDLIPMAHAIAPVFKDSAPRGPRDVIGLVNTNSMMVSYALEAWESLNGLFEKTHVLVALAMRSAGASDEPVRESVARLRINDHGYQLASKRIRKSLQEFPAPAVENRQWLQARYSIRCAPMVLGNCGELLGFALQKILQDAESVADNPVMVMDGDELKVAHAGLFYASSTATAADLMNDVAGKISEMLDRQVLILMDPKLSEGLPENLQVEGHGHLKGLHQLLSALNQQLRSLSTSSRLLSFSSEGNNQDIVPCAMSALNQLHSALEITRQAVRVSAFVMARGYCLRAGRELPGVLSLANWSRFEFENMYSVLKKNPAGSLFIDQAA